MQTWKTTTYPTCIATGIKEGTCTECKTPVTETIPISSQRHNVSKWETVRAGCYSEGGIDQGYCNDCHQVITVRNEAIPHTVERWTDTITATCTVPGERTGVCTACGETVKGSTPLHNVSEWKTVRPGCHPEGGMDQGYCNDCHQVITIRNEKKEHDFTRLILSVSSTEIMNGYEVYGCTNEGCEETKRITLPKLQGQAKEALLAHLTGMCGFGEENANSITEAVIEYLNTGDISELMSELQEIRPDLLNPDFTALSFIKVYRDALPYECAKHEWGELLYVSHGVYVAKCQYCPAEKTASTHDHKWMLQFDDSINWHYVCVKGNCKEELYGAMKSESEVDQINNLDEYDRNFIKSAPSILSDYKLTGEQLLNLTKHLHDNPELYRNNVGGFKACNTQTFIDLFREMTGIEITSLEVYSVLGTYYADAASRRLDKDIEELQELLEINKEYAIALFQAAYEMAEQTYDMLSENSMQMINDPSFANIVKWITVGKIDLKKNYENGMAALQDPTNFSKMLKWLSSEHYDVEKLTYIAKKAFDPSDKKEQWKAAYYLVSMIMSDGQDIYDCLDAYGIVGGQDFIIPDIYTVGGGGLVSYTTGRGTMEVLDYGSVKRICIDHFYEEYIPDLKSTCISFWLDNGYDPDPTANNGQGSSAPCQLVALDDSEEQLDPNEKAETMKSMLDKAINAGIDITISYNPETCIDQSGNPTVEVQYLRSLGYHFVQKDGIWQAVK